MKIIRVELRDNPAWTLEQLAKARKGRLKAVCHDGTPSADFACPECRAVQHIHLGQLEACPDGSIVRVRCLGLTCDVVFELVRDDALADLKELLA